MLITAFPAGPLAANCYVVAPAAGAECVIVDPGQQATDGVSQLVREHDLTPAAVLLTHGHFDHVLSAAEVCATYGVPARVHADDRELLTNPAKGLDPGLGGQLSALLGDTEMVEPEGLAELSGGERLTDAGLDLTARHVPGHTPGSVAYALATGSGEPDVVFTGDLLFAGSIGRTDFPGGDHPTILRSLAEVCREYPEETVVLPGHGPRTTVGRERASNPFLRDLG
ncbi:MBL fold metallo-hydrolase [Halostreptopolyspora alba]|uniref:MBL fold metallo-hydrolase n=1 Tax=Halostreptopolyspora alba TaxID=2487137 RepID=A0A3N0E7E9_9ACTN|nr:MBL fold metallo-hydrolase [Nocardiopsaceae bacterium YIM 96095]